MTLSRPEDLEEKYLPSAVRALMQGRLVGPEEWAVHFGCPHEVDQLVKAGPFPWTIEDLVAPCPFTPKKKVCETHVAFLGSSTLLDQAMTTLCLDDWQLFSGRGVLFSRASVEPLYFAKHGVLKDRWYLMLLDPARNAVRAPHRIRDARARLVSLGYELPRAVEEITKRVLFRRIDQVAMWMPQQIAFTANGTRQNPIVIASVGPGVVGVWPHPSQSTYANALIASRRLP